MRDNSRAKALANLCELVKTELDVKNLELSAPLVDQGFDSFRIAEVLLVLEELTGVRTGDVSVDDRTSLRSLLDAVVADG